MNCIDQVISRLGSTIKDTGECSLRHTEFSSKLFLGQTQLFHQLIYPILHLFDAYRGDHHPLLISKPQAKVYKVIRFCKLSYL